MKIRSSIVMTLGVSALCATLAGCINLPQTKALITPVGAIGIHSFAPRPEVPRSTDFEQRVAQQRLRSATDEQT
jgi:hypothetical protein